MGGRRGIARATPEALQARRSPASTMICAAETGTGANVGFQGWPELGPSYSPEPEPPSAPEREP